MGISIFLYVLGASAGRFFLGASAGTTSEVDASPEGDASKVDASGGSGRAGLLHHRRAASQETVQGAAPTRTSDAAGRSTGPRASAGRGASGGRSSAYAALNISL